MAEEGADWEDPTSFSLEVAAHTCHHNAPFVHICLAKGGRCHAVKGWRAGDHGQTKSGPLRQNLLLEDTRM
eukprot:6490113-Amphidinium_carterae.2